MADREKVIYSLERCYCMVPDACRDCAYNRLPARECVAQLAKDAMELLKPAKAIRMHNSKVIDIGEKVFVANCSNCSGYLIEGWKACPICGKAVTWDG